MSAINTPSGRQSASPRFPRTKRIQMLRPNWLTKTLLWFRGRPWEGGMPPGWATGYAWALRPAQPTFPPQATLRARIAAWASFFWATGPCAHIREQAWILRYENARLLHGRKQALLLFPSCPIHNGETTPHATATGGVPAQANPQARATGGNSIFPCSNSGAGDGAVQPQTRATETETGGAR